MLITDEIVVYNGVNYKVVDLMRMKLFSDRTYRKKYNNITSQEIVDYYAEILNSKVLYNNENCTILDLINSGTLNQSIVYTLYGKGNSLQKIVDNIDKVYKTDYLDEFDFQECLKRGLPNTFFNFKHFCTTQRLDPRKFKFLLETNLDANITDLIKIYRDTELGKKRIKTPIYWHIDLRSICFSLQVDYIFCEKQLILGKSINEALRISIFESFGLDSNTISKLCEIKEDIENSSERIIPLLLAQRGFDSSMLVYAIKYKRQSEIVKRSIQFYELQEEMEYGWEKEYRNEICALLNSSLDVSKMHKSFDQIQFREQSKLLQQKNMSFSEYNEAHKEFFKNFKLSKGTKEDIWFFEKLEAKKRIKTQ